MILSEKLYHRARAMFKSKTFKSSIIDLDRFIGRERNICFEFFKGAVITVDAIETDCEFIFTRLVQ